MKNIIDGLIDAGYDKDDAEMMMERCYLGSYFDGGQFAETISNVFIDHDAYWDEIEENYITVWVDDELHIFER